MGTVRLVLGAALLLGGCYTYAPASVAPGQASPVRLVLATPGDFRLSHLTANDILRVDGEMIRAGADSVLVSAQWLQARSGYEFPALGETVRVPRAQVAVIERKRISPLRTALLGAGLVLAVSATSTLVGGVGGSGDGGGRGPPGEQ